VTRLRWFVVGLLLSVLAGYWLVWRPKPVLVQPTPVTPSRLHVLAVGDSVQWGSVKGEIVKGCVVPHGRSMILEIETKGNRNAVGENR